MSSTFSCSTDAALLAGVRQARRAIEAGELVVIPTDTVYGVGANAFSPAAVQRLLDAKGRTRQSPPPVLVASNEGLAALTAEVPEPIHDLVAEFWPGGLTVILPAQPSLQWDLGETHGTVAVRMPDQAITLALLEDTGPLAVSSANLTGEPAALDAVEAERMLGESVSVYLDAGHVVGGVASTIVDATGLCFGAEEPKRGTIRIVRHGAISDDEIRRVVGDVLVPDIVNG